MSIPAVGSGGVSQAAAMGRMHLARQVAEAMVSEQDADQNCFLSLDETGLGQASFSAIDGDQDGQVSSQELVNGLRDRKEAMRQALSSGVGGQADSAQPGKGAQAGHLEALASRVAAGLDADGSGSVSLAESRLTAEGFAKVDGNGDGFITDAEIASAIRDRRDEAGAFLQSVQAAGPVTASEGTTTAAAETAPASTGATPAAAEPASAPALKPRMQQALAAYRGHMGELMTGLLAQQPAADQPVTDSALSLSVSA